MNAVLLEPNLQTLANPFSSIYSQQHSFPYDFILNRLHSSNLKKIGKTHKNKKDVSPPISIKSNVSPRSEEKVFIQNPKEPLARPNPLPAKEEITSHKNRTNCWPRKDLPLSNTPAWILRQLQRDTTEESLTIL